MSAKATNPIGQRAGVRVRRIYQSSIMTRLRRWIEARVQTNKVVSILIWLAGWYATSKLIEGLGVQSLLALLVMTTALQGALTVLERPLWCPQVVEVVDDPENPDAPPQEVPQTSDRDIAFGALVLDVLINAGGIWMIIRGLDKTPTWQMIVISLNLSSAMSNVVAMVLAFVLGYVIAKAPERVWRWE